MESEKTGVGATIADLPTCDFTVAADAPTECVKEAFDRRADLPGAIVVEGERILEVVSRDSLFRHLSRPFFREIFLRKPIREFVAMWCGDLLRLEAGCTINRAAELALARPHQKAFEPILVDYGDRVGLLDAQVLLVAQAQLLSLSRLVEAERDAAEAANRAKSEFLANISHELAPRCTASSVTPASDSTRPAPPSARNWASSSATSTTAPTPCCGWSTTCWTCRNWRRAG